MAYNAFKLGGEDKASHDALVDTIMQEGNEVYYMSQQILHALHTASMSGSELELTLLNHVYIHENDLLSYPKEGNLEPVYMVVMNIDKVFSDSERERLENYYAAVNDVVIRNGGSSMLLHILYITLNVHMLKHLLIDTCKHHSVFGLMCDDLYQVIYENDNPDMNK